MSSLKLSTFKKTKKRTHELAITLADQLDSFTCPISLEIMVDPVIAVDSFSYERENIERWFVSHSRSPRTNERLYDKTLLPNNALKESIQQYLLSLQQQNTHGSSINSSSICRSSSRKKRSCGNSVVKSTCRGSSGEEGEEDFSQINVKTITARIMRFRVVLGKTTIGELKQLIAAHDGTPTSQQQLIFGGKVWFDEKVLQDCAIEAECTLHLVLRLQGGN